MIIFVDQGDGIKGIKDILKTNSEQTFGKQNKILPYAASRATSSGSRDDSGHRRILNS